MWLIKKARKALAREIAELPQSILADLPGRLGVIARSHYWKTRFAYMGPGVMIGRNVKIGNPEFVSIGANAWIDDNVTILAGPPGERPVMHRMKGHRHEIEGNLLIGRNVHVAINVVLQAHGGIEIGDDVGIASGSTVYSLSHHYRNPGAKEDETLYRFGPMVHKELQSMIVGSVELKTGSAVGLNCIVLPGSVLEEFSWLGSGSLLSGRTPKGAIMTGNPAAVAKYRPGFKAEA